MSIARGLPSAASRAIWGDLEDEDEIETGTITDGKEIFCAGKEPHSGWNSVPRTPGILNYSAVLAKKVTEVDLRTSTQKEAGFDLPLHDEPVLFLPINSPDSSITPAVAANSSVILSTQAEKNHQEIEPADDQHSPLQPSPAATPNTSCNDQIEKDCLTTDLTKSIELDTELASKSQLPESVNETSFVGEIKSIEETQSSPNTVEINSNTSPVTSNTDYPEKPLKLPISPALDSVHVDAPEGESASSVSTSRPQSLRCIEKVEDIPLVTFEEKNQPGSVTLESNTATPLELNLPGPITSRIQIENEDTEKCDHDDDENELCRNAGTKMTDEFMPVENITFNGPQECLEDEKLINAINSNTINTQAENKVVEDETTSDLYSQDESEKESEENTVLEIGVNTTNFSHEFLPEITELHVPAEYKEGHEESNSTNLNELQQSMETHEIKTTMQEAIAISSSSISQIDHAEDEVKEEISVGYAFSEVAKASHSSLSSSISLSGNSPQQVDTIDASQVMISTSGFPDEYSETLNTSVSEEGNSQYLHTDSHSTRSSTSQYAVRDISEAEDLLKTATQTSLDTSEDKIQKEDSDNVSNYSSKMQNENAQDIEHDIPAHQTNSDDGEKMAENDSTSHDRNELENISSRIGCMDRNSVDQDNDESKPQCLKDQSKQNPNIITKDSQPNDLENNGTKEIQEPSTKDSKSQSHENEQNVIIPDTGDDKSFVQKQTTSPNQNLTHIKHSNLDIKKKKHRYSHSGSSLLDKRKKSLKEKIRVISDKLHIHKV